MPALSVAGFQDLVVTVEDGVYTIAINRPATYNSLVLKTYKEISRALRDADSRPEVVVTALTGVGSFFSSGADFVEMTSGKSKVEGDVKQALREMFEATSFEVTRLALGHTKVLVVLLNGPVVGFPAGLISLADIIYASETAWIHAPFTALGICPEGGASVGFIRRMGFSAANEALLFGRKFTAHELEKNGFVNRVFKKEEFEAETKKLLQAAVKNSEAVSLLVSKRLIRNQFRDGDIAATSLEMKRVLEAFESGAPLLAFRRLLEQSKEKKKAKL